MAFFSHTSVAGLWLLSGLLSAPSAWATPAESATEGASNTFARYQIILDKKPFGEVSPVETAVVPPGESFAKDLEPRGITDDGLGTTTSVEVSLFDKKTNKTIRLSAGQPAEGLELVSADYDAEEFTVRKGSETAHFNLKAAKTGSGPVAATPPPSPFGGPPTGIPPPPFLMGTNAAPPVFGAVSGSGNQAPFFSSRKRRGSPFRRDGTNTAFRGDTIETFLKAHPEASTQFPSPFPAPGSPFKTEGKGDTIERLLRQQGGVTNPFFPLAPTAPGAAPGGNPFEQLMRDNAGQPPALPAPMPFAPAEEFLEIPAE